MSRGMEAREAARVSITPEHTSCVHGPLLVLSSTHCVVFVCAENDSDCVHTVVFVCCPYYGVKRRRKRYLDI